MDTETKKIKDELVNHLKKQNVESISELWAEAKNYCDVIYDHVGGSYASFGNFITLNILDENKRYRFNVYLSEIIETI